VTLGAAPRSRRRGLDAGITGWHRVSSKLLAVEVTGILIAGLVGVAVAVAVGFANATAGWVLGGAVAVVTVIRLVIARARVRSIGYVLREDDLVLRRGILYSRLVAVPYGRMQLVDVTRGPVARLLGLAELLSLDLVLLMLAGGALVGLLVSLTAAGVPLQIVAAAVTAISMLLLVRPNIVRRLHNGPELRTGPAALIGKEGFALAEVTVHGGQVKLAGEVWSARPYDDDDVIPVGAKVEVFEIRGATAYVHEVPQLGS